jgi:hypothetical protein
MRPLGAAPRCQRCGYDLAGIPTGLCPECGKAPFDAASSDAESADRSVWDEPVLSPALAGAPAPDAPTYAAWLRDRQARTAASATWATTIAVALAAGPWAVLGAFMGGESTFGFLLLTVIGPIVEEVMKTAAAAYVVERRPYLFSSRVQILLCGVAAGLVFAAIENVLYLKVYVKNPGADLIAWRWTVCTFLHMGCTLIASLGLARIWSATDRSATRPDLALGYPYLVTAIVVHGSYNTLALLLSLTNTAF